MGLFDSLTDKVKDILPDQVEEMLKGQGVDQIMNLIMDKVKPGKHEDVKALVTDAVKKSDDGNLDHDGIQGIIKNISGHIKPEYIDEVKKLAMGFLNKGN